MCENFVKRGSGSVKTHQFCGSVKITWKVRAKLPKIAFLKLALFLRINLFLFLFHVIVIQAINFTDDLIAYCG